MPVLLGTLEIIIWRSYQHFWTFYQQGFENSYSKTESGKNSKFYGDNDFKKYSGDHDHLDSFFSSEKGGGTKGGEHSVSAYNFPFHHKCDCDVKMQSIKQLLI